MIETASLPPTLSIVVPTLERRLLLQKTLDVLSDEVARFRTEVELVVVDNASTDGTRDLLLSSRLRWNARSVLFDHRVEIDASFQRCVECTYGKYIVIFGDDDIALPGFVETTLKVIKEHEPDLVYFNRLIGDERLVHIAEIAHTNRGLNIEVLESAAFIREFNHHAGFITSVIFSRETWVRGGQFSSRQFPGFMFLARIYGGLQGKCVYVGLPMIVQRRGVQTWKSEWPRYWLVSMPDMLRELEVKGATIGALDQWRDKEVTAYRILVDCIVAKAYGYHIGDYFWEAARSYQRPRKSILIQLIRWLCPSALARVAYFRLSKYKHEL